jgi:saccharopine dehydrogenase-like NADP-dependent oxidoreductase
MGRYAVQTAVEYDFVDEVVVADVDAKAAERFADASGPKAKAAALDVSDADALGRLLSDADVALNCVGPFYRFGVPVLRAAIDARCHYLDINDDWEPTLEMLELDRPAREARITAIVGMGASPGVSNLLAVLAMNQLDSVEDLVTGWGFGGGSIADGESLETAPGRPSAALVHWLHQCSGTIRICRDGAFVDVPPLEEVRVDYPGIGAGTAWTVGHPEPVTLANYRPEVRNSYNVMVGPRRSVEAVRSIAGEIDAGRVSTEEGAALLLDPARREEDAGARAAAESQEPRLPPLFAVASGRRGGEAARAAATVLGMPAGGMGGATGVPLAVVLALFAKGQLDCRGVVAPEAVIDPHAFFDALAPHCSEPFATGEEMILITKTWQP